MGQRIIVIEDDESVYELIKFVLEERGFSITRVSVAAIAETVVGVQDYDYFIVDLGLVGGDGQDVLKAINRAHPGHRERILVHTGRDLDQDDEDQLSLLAGRVVHKGPDSIDELLKVIN